MGVWLGVGWGKGEDALDPEQANTGGSLSVADLTITNMAQMTPYIMAAHCR